MLQALSILPVSFWVAVLLLLAGGAWAAGKIQTGLGLPMLAVMGTVAVWYVGDALYNDYTHNHAELFAPEVLDDAWWQVAWFLATFLLLAPVMHGQMNGWNRAGTSQLFRLSQNGAMEPKLQSHLNKFFWGIAKVWAVLVAVACLRLGDQTPYYFFPFLGHRADPWGRAQIGGGISALLSLAGDLQIFAAAMFGLVAALARNRQVRSLAFLCCCLTWPYYIFDRTRNTLLVIVLPAVLSGVFVRWRSGLVAKVAGLAVCFALINLWFAFIIANRSHTSMAAALRGEGVSLKQARQEAHHEGLNMFEELCWVNTYIRNDFFPINHGANYYANLVNPIPRSLWPGKPLIGLDYAQARGQGWNEEGTTATISTGLIGQGVVNFGRFIGPAFAALLLGLWAAFLARLDLQGQQMGKLGICLLGMVETFNLGRDITFIALYPVIFGLIIVWWTERRSKARGHQPPKPKRGKR